MLLAGKFEEREDRVPKLETLNSLRCMRSMNLVLTKQGLLRMELLLLETFQWNLYLPTAAHFIDYCLSVAVHEGDLHDGWPLTCLKKTRLYMAKYADYFLEVSLQGELPLWPVHPAAERRHAGSSVALCGSRSSSVPELARSSRAERVTRRKSPFSHSSLPRAPRRHLSSLKGTKSQLVKRKVQGFF